MKKEKKTIRPSQVKIIKHISTKRQTLIEKETTYLVKSTTPFISGLKRIKKIIDKFENENTSSNEHLKKYRKGDYKNIKFIKIKGMGKAIEKTISLGLHFNENYKICIYSGTCEVLDELIFDENSESENALEKQTFKRRNVSFVEIHIFLKQFEEAIDPI